MQVDVIIATYNSANFIRETLNSIFDQSYPDFKIYINDDASQDETVEIIGEFKKKWPDKISLVINPTNLGPTKNSQMLLARTRSNLVFFCGHDDIFYKNKIQICVERFLSDPNITLIYHDCLVKSDIGPAFPFSKTHKPRRGEAFKYLIYGCFSTACSVAVKGEHARSIGIKEIGASSDSLLFYEVAKFGKIEFIDQVLGEYRRHNNNLTKLGTNKIDFSAFKATCYIMERYPEDKLYSIINLNWVIIKILYSNKFLLIFYFFSPFLTVFWLVWLKFGMKKID